MKGDTTKPEADPDDAATSAIDQSIENLIRATKGYLRMLCILGAMPWRAGRIATEKAGVITFSATFLFVSSLILSLVLGVAVELWRLADLDELSNLALAQVRMALEPEYAKAIVSLFPGILCAEVSAWIVARIVTGDLAKREQMRRFALLAFALHALLVALVLAVSIALLESMIGNAIGDVMSAVYGGSHRRTLFERFLDFWFDDGPIVIPAFLIIHFSVVMWFGAQAISPPGPATRQSSGRFRVPTGRQWRILLVAHLYPLLLALYVIAILLPHAAVAALKPRELAHVTMRIEADRSPDGANRAKITVVMKNNMTRPVMFERDGFSLQFSSEKETNLYHTHAAVLDWAAATAPLITVPSGATQWIVLQIPWPSNVCTKNQSSDGSASASVQVQAEESFSDQHENFNSQSTPFC